MFHQEEKGHGDLPDYQVVVNPRMDPVSKKFIDRIISLRGFKRLTTEELLLIRSEDFMRKAIRALDEEGRTAGDICSLLSTSRTWLRNLEISQTLIGSFIYHLLSGRNIAFHQGEIHLDALLTEINDEIIAKKWFATGFWWYAIEAPLFLTELGLDFEAVNYNDKTLPVFVHVQDFQDFPPPRLSLDQSTVIMDHFMPWVAKVDLELKAIFLISRSVSEFELDKKRRILQTAAHYLEAYTGPYPIFFPELVKRLIFIYGLVLRSEYRAFEVAKRAVLSPPCQNVTEFCPCEHIYQCLRSYISQVRKNHEAELFEWLISFNGLE